MLTFHALAVLRQSEKELSVAIGIIPLVDYAFKMLFGNEEHRPVTIHFLNSVLAHRGRQSLHPRCSGH